ncbi:hypothetical protein NUACC21_08820 [Scytonema sp. NUACC21]
MKLLESKLKYLLTFKLALIGITSSLLLTLDAKAQEKMTGQAEPKNLPINSSSLAQGQVCPSPKLRPRRQFETAKYSVYICRGEKTGSLGYYVRISKNDGGRTTLPVSQTIGETYIAVKEELAHVVTPYELLVSKQGRIILKERVKSAVKGDGQLLTISCPKDENTLVEAETKGFIIYICGQEVPRSYVSVAKNGNDAVTLPLLSYKPQSETKDSQFLAVNGNVRYILTRNVLRVIHDGRTIVKEKVVGWNS